MAERNLGGRPAKSSREAVVEAGLEILKRDGLGAVTLSAVAEKLGLGKVAMYTYVDNKDDLLLAMRDEINGRLLLAMQADVALAPEDALKATCARALAVSTDYGQLLVAVEPDLTGPGGGVGERFLEILAQLGLTPALQLRVYLLLVSVVNSFVPRGTAPAPALPSDERIAQLDASQYPLLAGLYKEVGGPPEALIDDLLSLIIDVLIPTLHP